MESLTIIKDMKEQIENIISRRNQSQKVASHPTILREILNSSDLPPEEKTPTRLQDKSVNLVGAGTHTIRWTVGVASFYVLSRPEILHRLKSELVRAWPHIEATPTLQELEKLPYLTAIIQEGQLWDFLRIVK